MKLSTILQSPKTRKAIKTLLTFAFTAAILTPTTVFAANNTVIDTAKSITTILGIIAIIFGGGYSLFGLFNMLSAKAEGDDNGPAAAKAEKKISGGLAFIVIGGMMWALSGPISQFITNLFANVPE